MTDQKAIPTDTFSAYEVGLRQLLEELGRDHPRYAEALTYQQRLEENLSQARRYGDTETRGATRAEIIDRLNELTLAELGVSFNELCAALPPQRHEPSKYVPLQRHPRATHFTGREEELAKPRIFLCHASEDKERVKELYHQLKEAGYSPRLDKYDLLPGQNWRVEIRKMLGDHNNLVVVCLSNSSVTKRGTVQREIKWALDLLEEMPEGAIYLIPARLERCQVPERLKDLHGVDLFEPDGFEYLTRSLDFEIANRKPPAEPGKVKAPDVETSKQPAPPKPTLSTPAPQPIEPELIHIPAGEFLMGSDPDKDKYARDDEQPQHTVYLPEYYIAKTPVTNAQYAAFVEATGHGEPSHWPGDKPPTNKADHPVVGVSWHDAMAYCRWLGEATGKAYRLPSEAEWENAARGTDGRIYPWGNEWNTRRCNVREEGPSDTTPVEMYSPQGDSPYGCVDMAGNVWEWTLNLWGKSEDDPDFKYPYNPQDGQEDLEADNEILRVLRGGSWYNSQSDARCASRDRLLPIGKRSYDGFRLCVAAQQE